MNREELTRACVVKGLAQIPKDGLKRLVDYIDAGKPLCLNGDVVDEEGDP